MKVPLRVLLVHDSAADAEPLVHELHKGGYDLSCRRVATAEEMVMALDGEAWDIVLADYLLSGFGGLAVLELLKGTGVDIPCLVCSFHDEAETVVAAMKAGARDYLVREKSGRLVPAVRRALQESNHERAVLVEEKACRGIDRDISVGKRTEEKLRSLQMAVETMQIGVTITDLNGSIIYTNPAEALMHGYTVEELIGKDVRIFAPPVIWNKMDLEQIKQMGSRHRESRNVRKDGTVFPVHLLSDVVVDNNGNPLAVVSTCEDITERKRIEEKLTYMSTHDSLTGLYNRTFFDEELARLGRGRQFPVSVLIGDVDDLKEVNDTLGHEAGDLQIKKAARVLVEALRAEDIVARIGGDEFAAILPRTVAATARDITARIRNALAIENGLHSGPSLSVSLGVATVENGKRLTDAWKLADMRMYEDKLSRGSRRTGKNQEQEKNMNE